MILNNRQKERLGINTVANMIEVEWGCGWQEYAAQNDEGIDGVILMRRGQKKTVDTGGIVFAQVKCGGDGYRQDQKQYPDKIGIALGADYVTKHQERWLRVPGPAILIFVDDSVSRINPPAWWTNLKDGASYSRTNKGIILVPKNQRFGRHTKGIFHKLCGSGPTDRPLPTLRLSSDNNIHPKLGRAESLRNDAWLYYKDWRSTTADCMNPALGPILVNRVGWKHITRFGRLSERIIQSWLLLGAAREIVKRVSDVDYLGRAKITHLDAGLSEVSDYLGLRATVVFPYRHHSVVQVVLKRSRLVNSSTGVTHQKIWFYSIYERRRGAGLV
jgi:hypothetical protein